MSKDHHTPTEDGRAPRECASVSTEYHSVQSFVAYSGSDIPSHRLAHPQGEGIHRYDYWKMGSIGGPS